MLLNETIDILVTNKNWKYYSDLGYDVTKEDIHVKKIISVTQQEVQKGVRKNILLHVKCDFCGEEYYESPYNYYEKRKRCIIDSCANGSCRLKRNNHIKMSKYGTINFKEISDMHGIQLGRSTKYCWDDVLKRAKEKHYTVLSDFLSHVRVKDIVDFECDIHHVKFTSKIERLFSESHNCPCCHSEYISGILSTVTIDDAIKLMDEKGYQLVSPDFIHNCDETIQYICKKHPNYGIQNTSLYNLKNHKYNCRLCSLPKGEDHYNWKGGITSSRDADMVSFEYVNWKKYILKRDNYTCQCCNKKGGSLNVHHIFNYADNPDKRIDVDNGICLCEECHLNSYPNSFHKKYGVHNNNLVQLQEFFDYRREELGLPLIDINTIIHSNNS